MIFVVLALSLALSLFLGKEAVNLFVTKNKEVSNKHRAAAELAVALRKAGLSKLPEFLIDYSVGDLVGMAEKIYDLGNMVRAGGDAVIIKEFDTVFQNVLAAKLGTPEGVAYILSLTAEAKEKFDKAKAAVTTVGLAG